MSEKQVESMRAELLAIGMSEEKVAVIMAEVQKQGVDSLKASLR